MDRNVPSELIDAFVDHNHDDQAALLACALVSRQWTPASRYHLFSDVQISHENAREFIHLLASPNCTFSGVLNGLTIDFVPGSQRWFSEFSRRLSSFDRITITSLTLSGSRNTLIREEATHALSLYFGQITHLSVAAVVFASFADFARLLCGFRALASLACACTFQLSGHPADVQFAAPLRRLALASPAVDRVFEFLLVHGALPTLASLALAHPAGADYAHLARYLSTSNDALQALSIRMDSGFSGVSIDDFTERLDMTQLRALCHLVLDTTPGLPPDQASMLLTSISSPHLKTLKIALQLVHGVARIDILLSGGRFPSLREVVVLRASWADVRQFLPRCDAGGILRAV